MGAAVGKVGNVATKSDLARDLADVITPGTSGVLAVVDLTAVDAVKQTIPEATEVKSVPIDDQTGAAVTEAAQAASSGAPAG